MPGFLNVIADRLSRPNQPIATEWSLHSEIMQRIFGTWGTPTEDMRATVHNTHLPKFMSLIMPRALAIDALSQDWQGWLMSMFPPFFLLNKVIKKLRSTQEGEVILIASGGVTTMDSTSALSVCGPPSHHSAPSGPTLTTGVCLVR